MIKATLKQGYNDIELEYDTIESVEELIRGSWKRSGNREPDNLYCT